MNILIEATGSLTSTYLIKAIKESGHKVIGSDIVEFNHSKYLCDDFVIMPKVKDLNLWEKVEIILKEKAIDIVIPSLDETLLEWAERKEYFKNIGVDIILSPKNTIDTFQDKWKTYIFFTENNIPTAKTSLSSDLNLIKLRFGRGGTGIFDNNYIEKLDMVDYISQEKIYGNEYTVDTLFSKDGEPIYIVPRLRIDVKDGKSTKGIVVKNENIDNLVLEISRKIKFVGPINFQLFETKEKELIMIEINPRVAGGMALGFAATENWIKIIIENIVLNKEIIKVKPINYGMKMFRYYDELFV